MLNWYLDFLKDHLLLSSAIQVAILGTLGELLGMAPPRQVQPRQFQLVRVVRWAS